jgi:hypothetical protein
VQEMMKKKEASGGASQKPPFPPKAGWEKWFSVMLYLRRWLCYTFIMWSWFHSYFMKIYFNFFLWKKSTLSKFAHTVTFLR